MLESVKRLPEFIYAVNSEKRRKLIGEVLEEFAKRVVALSHNFERGLLHGDINEQNILVKKMNGEWKISAILDFGDSHYGCYLYELALALTYMMLVSNSLEVPGYVLAGYLTHMNISEEEYSLLKVTQLYLKIRNLF